MKSVDAVAREFVGCGGGSGEAIVPGAAGWVTPRLPPGHFELICNLPGHYAMGMYAEFGVS